MAGNTAVANAGLKEGSRRLATVQGTTRSQQPHRRRRHARGGYAAGADLPKRRTLLLAAVKLSWCRDMPDVVLLPFYLGLNMRERAVLMKSRRTTSLTINAFSMPNINRACLRRHLSLWRTWAHTHLPNTTHLRIHALTTHRYTAHALLHTLPGLRAAALTAPRQRM